MKRLLLAPLVLLFLSGCGYGSQKEAMDACKREWEQIGIYPKTHKDYFRRCDDEPSSRKVLGLYWKSQFSGSFVEKRYSY